MTPQRKQNNRKAQQRYREKRKQQAAERENQVAVLSSQLAAMQSIQNQHAAVSSENVHLRKVLLAKEAEIENLKVHPEPCVVDEQRHTPTALSCALSSVLGIYRTFQPRHHHILPRAQCFCSCSVLASAIPSDPLT